LVHEQNGYDYSLDAQLKAIENRNKFFDKIINY